MEDVAKVLFDLEQICFFFLFCLVRKDIECTLMFRLCWMMFRFGLAAFHHFLVSYLVSCSLITNIFAMWLQQYGSERRNISNQVLSFSCAILSFQMTDIHTIQAVRCGFGF